MAVDHSTRRAPRIRCVGAVVALMVAGFAVLAGQASASTTVGQLFAPAAGCGANTFLQTGVAAGTSYIVPSAGVITSWRFENDSTTVSGLKLKVGRHTTAPDTFTIVGDSPAGTQVPNTVNGPYRVRIPVQAGDLIGIFTSGTGDCSLHTSSASDTYDAVPGDQAPGTTATYNALTNLKVPVQAIVEPDANGDGYGDDTQEKADLGIAKSGPATATVGGNVAYTLTATNHGPEAAPGVVVSDPLPAGTALVSAASSAGGCDATVRCSLGSLASGASATITIVVKATQSGNLSNTATIDSQGLDAAAHNYPGRGDTNTANNSASAATTVSPLPARVSGASETNSSFSDSARPKLVTVARKHRRIGTTFKYTLNQPAGVHFDFTQRARGRKVNRKCVAQSKHNKHKRKCTRTVIRGTLSFAGHAGQNTVKFYGWLSKHKKLKPGKYTLVITATTPGVGSTSQKLKFTIVR